MKNRLIRIDFAFKTATRYSTNHVACKSHVFRNLISKYFKEKYLGDIRLRNPRYVKILPKNTRGEGRGEGYPLDLKEAALTVRLA